MAKTKRCIRLPALPLGRKKTSIDRDDGALNVAR